ncbi:MAG TPA: hypothetical protein VME69_08605 [Methylocella sp.]|nr:hypothetical protein [Methylocella sp.]
MSVEPSTLCIVESGNEYELLAAEDRSAFALRFKTDHLISNIEGEDAIRFQKDYEDIKSQYPDWPADQTLAQLWDQGGYSWLAIEEAV